MKRLKEYQNLIAGLSLAISIAYAGSGLLMLAFRAGEAVSQHNYIIQMLHEKCR